MKKNLPKDTDEMLDDMFGGIDEEMSRRELHGYVTNDNQPKIAELEADREVTVSDVLVIGGYIAVAKLHNDAHTDHGHEAVPDVSVTMLGGDLDNLSPEARKAITEAVEQLTKHLRKGKGKKK